MRIKMQSNITRVVILAAVFFFAVASPAQTRKTKKPVKKQVARTASRPAPARYAPAKKRTVGELLQGIRTDSRGGKLAITKSQIALPEVQQQQRVNSIPLTELKPPKSDELLRGAEGDEAELERVTDKGIQTLYSLAQKYAKSKNRGELWLRLAEQYVEKAKFIEYRLQKEYDDKLMAYQAKKGPKPVLNLSKSREYNLKAIRLYEYFLRDFPQDARVDQALFFLGYNYVELDQVLKGIDFYKKLTKEKPNSDYVGEAYFALGEYYFENDKWADAYKAYSDVLKNRRARLYTFALYKMAWCQYRMGRVGQGLTTLEQVVKLSRAAPETRKDGRKQVSRIRLGSEALKDLVLFYSDVGNYKNARNYFWQVGGEKAYYPMLEKLAYIYTDLGKKEEAYFVFKQLLEQNPVAPKAFDYQYQIVTIFSTSKNQQTYRNELYTWIDHYGRDSDWAKANAKNQKLIEDAYTLRESALRNYTLLMHKNAQNTGKKQELINTKDAYQLYLTKFADSPNATEMHFFYAELLYAINDFENAAKEYRYVADKDPKGKYHELATLNALLSLEKGLKTDEELKQMVGESLEPVAFNEVETNFMVAADRYIKNFPKGDRIVDVKFKVGRLYYSFNQFDKALKIFDGIITNHGKTPYAVYSANLVLDIYNLRKDYDSLSREGTRFMKNRDLTSQGFQTDVRDVVEKASFKKGLEMETAKNYEGSAKAFSDFAKNYPTSPLAAKAIYNSGINYERAQKFPEAIAMYTKIERTPKKGNEQMHQQSALLLGRLYEQTAQYDKAAAQFERYARENPKDAKTPDLYYNAAVIHEGQRDAFKAMDSYEKYFQLSRKSDRTEALFAIAKIREKRSNFKLAQEAYQRYLDNGGADPEKVVEAHFKIADIHEKKGASREAEKGYNRTIAVQKVLAQKGKVAGLVWASEAKFRLTEAVYNELASIRIPANPKRQGEAVKQKLALLTKLGNNLTAVIQYDEGNMVIASLARLGQGYEHMSKSIRKAPIPGGLTKEETEAYKKGVEGVAKPLEDKAIENYTLAINKSFEINYYNNWTKVALEAMSRYQPDKFVEPKEIAIPVARTDEMGLY